MTGPPRITTTIDMMSGKARAAGATTLAFALAQCMTACASPALAAPERAAAEGCEIIRDDGTHFVDRTVSSCRDYYPPDHACADVKTQSAGICANQNMIKGVDRAGVDMIINPHRGVWGLKLSKDAATQPSFSVSVGGAPENSLGGVTSAVTAGFKTVEYDFLLTYWRDNVECVPAPFVTHFTDYRGFTNYGGPQSFQDEAPEGFVFTPTWCLDDPNLLRLRNRNGDISKDRLLDLAEFLNNSFAEKDDLVVVLDVKFPAPLRQMRRSAGGDVEQVCLAFCEYADKTLRAEEAIEAMRQAASTISAMGGDHEANPLAQVIFKIPQGTFPMGPAAFEEALGPVFDELLFAPGPDISGRMEPETVLAWIDAWNSGQHAKHVAFWDTSIRSAWSWMARSFVWNGKVHSDLPTYLIETTGRRSAIWTPDPSGPGGRHGNYAMSWTLYGSERDDTRGDYTSNFVPKYTKNALITSDRPDIMLQIRKLIKKVRQEADS